MRALVAMSGGVDSSVAAALMVEQGHDVIGVTLKQWEGPDGALPIAGCCTLGDAEDARRVAAQLDVPYYVLDHVDDFTSRVVDRFGADYAAGRTPNPCVDCNRRVRFSVLLDRVAELGCDVLVTGHYARIDRVAGRFRLRRGIDPSKDQSYVLHMLGQDALSRVVLPIGGLRKSAVREHAARLGLRTAAKPDSQDICFVAGGDYRDFLRTRFPATVGRGGDVVDIDGEVLAEHAGTVDFTIGQRRGLGVALGEPRYVVDIRPETATVVVGHRRDLLVDGCEMEEVTFVSGGPPADPGVDVEVRYRARPVRGRLVDRDGWRVHFDRPTGPVAPGQAAVFYDGDVVVGGGTIASTFRG